MVKKKSRGAVNPLFQVQPLIGTQCEICLRTFTTKSGFGIHKQAAHSLTMSDCNFCGRAFRHLASHAPMCILNPNNEENRAKIGAAQLGKSHSQETKDNLREIALRKIDEGTWHTSFSKKRIIEYSGEKFDGSWEFKLAVWFDAHNVKWKRNKQSFPYTFDGRQKRYTPDFFLPDIDCFVEVKGWAVTKDRAKWSHFNRRLVVLSGADLFRMGIDVHPFKDWRL